MAKVKTKAKNVMEVYKKANMIIESKYSKSIGVNRLLAISLYSIQNGNYEKQEGLYVCKFSASQIAGYTKDGMSGGSFYKYLKNLANEITDFKVFAEDFDKRSFQYIVLVTKAKFENGQLEMSFTKDAITFLQEVTQNYTTFEIKTMMQFKSNYAFRIYEWLRSKAYYFKNEDRSIAPKKFHVSVGLSELKFIVGVLDINSETAKKVIIPGNDCPDYELAEKEFAETNPDQKYMKWSNFKTRILDQAVAEINEKSDIDISYTYQRKGRSVSLIEFEVEYKVDKARREQIEKEEIDESNIIDAVHVEVNDVENDVEKEANVIRITKATPPNVVTGHTGRPFMDPFSVFEGPVPRTNTEKEETKKNVETKTDFCDQDEMRQRVEAELVSALGETVNTNTVEKVCIAADWDLQKVKNAVSMYKCNSRNIDNPIAWILSAIREDYFSTRKTPKNGFNNFKGRNYTAEQYREFQAQLIRKGMMGAK